MRAGHGRAPLHVPAGTPLGGYAARTGPASGVLDELGVDCISLAGQRGRLLLVVADVLCATDELAAAVRSAVRTALDGHADVWTCATHTHSGPDVGCAAERTPPAWRAAIAEAAVAAARTAIAAEVPCSGRLRTGVLRDVGSPRGLDDAPARVSVDVVSLSATDGRLAGVLAVVPVHPTVLPASSTLVSADLLGAIRRGLRRRLGGERGPWVVVAQGAGGDISTRRTRLAQTPQECERLGEVAAGQLAEALAEAPARVWDERDGGPVAASSTLQFAPHRRGREQLDVLRERLAARRGALMQRGDVAGARTTETALQGIAVAEANARDDDAAVAVTVSAARLGRLALLAIGGEPFSAIADELRERCGPHAVVLGCANGHAGYLPDDAADPDAYEALASRLAPGAATAVADALTELLRTTGRIP